MLFDVKTGNVVTYPKNNKMPDNIKRSVVEKCIPLSYAHNKMFRLEERARFKV